MKWILVGISICIIVSLSVLSFLLLQPSPEKSAIGNPVILAEINRLLLPVVNQSITAEDFQNLRGLVKSDAIAADKVRELVVLAAKREYSHVGHGLGSLHLYIRTGVERACAGHHLAHYYVFTKHGERELADENLREARVQIEKHETSSELFLAALARIDSGNVSASEDEIAELSDAECLYA